MDTSWGDTVGTTVAEQSDEKKQGSEAWKQWRNKGLGSSDAAVLLGWSPWKKITELYEEKLGLWKPTFGAFQQRAMARGTELEPVIRAWYENQVGTKFTEDTEEDRNPVFAYRRASYDGINREFKNPDGTIGKIIEIKAPAAKEHELAKNGMIPEKYIPQVQWLMMIAGVSHADYISYGTDDTYAVVPMKANPVIQNELAERAQLFWQHVLTKTPIVVWYKFEEDFAIPIDLGSKEIINPKGEEKPVVQEEPTEQIEEQEIEAVIAAALAAQDEAKKATAKFEALKEKVKKFLGKETEMVRGEASFGYISRKGAVDYSIIPELIGLDLDQFRKPPTKAFYFERVAQKK